MVKYNINANNSLSTLLQNETTCSFQICTNHSQKANIYVKLQGKFQYIRKKNINQTIHNILEKRT